MCFDQDSHPPIPPIAGAAVDGKRITLHAVRRDRLRCVRRPPAEPTGAGDAHPARRSRPVHFYEELALRFAEAGVDGAGDRLLRPHGRHADRAARTSTTWRTSSSCAGDRCSTTSQAGADELARALASARCSRRLLHGRAPRVPDRRRARSSASRASIGFYGWPPRPRGDMPAPIDEVARGRRRRCSACSAATIRASRQTPSPLSTARSRRPASSTRS